MRLPGVHPRPTLILAELLWPPAEVIHISYVDTRYRILKGFFGGEVILPEVGSDRPQHYRKLHFLYLFGLRILHMTV